MLSSIGDWKEVKGLEGESVDASLLKPVRRSKLIRTLVETWSRKSALAGASSGPALRALHENVIERFAPSEVRALVVEDNPVNQRVALRLLQRLGTEVDVAGNGFEALEFLKASRYDFVFMDCQMPELDGYETTKRSSPQGRPEPTRESRCVDGGCGERMPRAVPRGRNGRFYYQASETRRLHSRA
jgi:two-component system sensor histidine kinase/response regulator